MRTDHRLQTTFVFFIENALTRKPNGMLSAADGELQRGLTLTFGCRLF